MTENAMKKDARKQTRKKLLDRRQQVIDLYKEGTPKMQIVNKSGLSWSAVDNAIKLYQNDPARLEPAARGRKPGSGRILSEAQEIEIRELISTKRPFQTGVRSQYLWDRHAIMKLVKQKYEIQLSTRVMGNYLKSWGFVIKKSTKHPYDRCAADIREWLDQNYPGIKKRAENEKAEILWLSKSIVEGNKKQWMITAINNQRKMRWLVIRQEFNAEKQIGFLKALVKDVKKKVFLIPNNQTYYHSEPVSEWIRREKEKIELFPPPQILKDRQSEKSKSFGVYEAELFDDDYY